MVNHPNRSRRPRAAPLHPVRLTAEECWLILHALRIACEDGSIYGARMPGDADYDEMSNQIGVIEGKLKTARRYLDAPITGLER